MNQHTLNLASSSGVRSVRSVGMLISIVILFLFYRFLFWCMFCSIYLLYFCITFYSSNFTYMYPFTLYWFVSKTFTTTLTFSCNLLFDILPLPLTEIDSSCPAWARSNLEKKNYFITFTHISLVQEMSTHDICLYRQRYGLSVNTLFWPPAAVPRQLEAGFGACSLCT